MITMTQSVMHFKGDAIPIDGFTQERPCMWWLQHWIDAAMFFLGKAQYILHPDIRTVQSIVILRDVFPVVGKPTLLSTLWPVAISIAQRLKLNDESELESRMALDAEICRRLWWSLVIGDWCVSVTINGQSS